MKEKFLRGAHDTSTSLWLWNISDSRIVFLNVFVVGKLNKTESSSDRKLGDLLSKRVKASHSFVEGRRLPAFAVLSIYN